MKKSILKSIDLLLSFNLKKSIGFFIFLLIAILFETLSVALIVPLVDIVTSKEGSDYYDLLQRFNFLKIENIFLFSLIAFLLIILIKTLYLIFFSWWKNDFISELNTSFSSKLFHQYLSKSYLDLSKTDTSIIIRNCWEEVRILTGGLNNLFLLFVEFLVFSSIIIVLFLYDPKTSIFIFVFFLIIGLSYIYLTKGKITQWSKNKIFLTSNIIKSINECFGLIKYIRLRNKENFFFNRFNHPVLRINRLTRNLSFTREIPKNILEMIAISSLFFVVLINLDSTNGVSKNLISLLAIYAGAAFRILPAINRIINLVQAFYNYIPTLDILYHDLVSKKNSNFFNNLIDDNNKFQFKDIIEFKNVYFKYDDQEDYVIENLSFTINKNDFVCFVGESGVGKSTLIDLLTGILIPTKGNIYVDNIDTKNILPKYQNIIGIVPQKTRLINDSLLSNIILESDEKLKNEKRFNNAIKFAQLEKTIKENKDGIQYSVGQDGSSLSGGQGQRIAIARALYESPEILILDEITSALDSKTSQQLFNCINDLIGKKTLIMVSHNEDLSKRADKVFRLTKDQNQTNLIKLYEKN